VTHPVAGNRRFEIQEVITMKNTSKPVYTIETCLDILDWFNDPDFEYINHILVSKLDGEERIRRAMPSISDYCLKLVAAHSAGEDAYPQAV
jgi:hypothetical protein